MTAPLTNWAGNHTFAAAQVLRPETIEQLQAQVARTPRLRALGTRHSFNPIADSPHVLVSLEHFNRAEQVDVRRQTVTVEAGARYGDLSRALDRAGFALHNLASLPHISVAGACATATHGSGDQNGNLATAVAAFEMVTATGERMAWSRAHSGPDFQGAVVSLGGLGVVTRLTLDLVPAFVMRQDLYENLPLAALVERFDEVFSSAYSVSLFTDWREPRFNQVWLKRRVHAGETFTAPPDLYGATLAERALHPIGRLSAESCTEQLGRAGPWHERLPHFRLDFTPSSGEELQTEYFVPRPQAVAALQAVATLSPQIAPLLLISEVRTIAADELWMSPCYRQASLAIHFTWKRDWPEVKQLLPRIEDRLAPFKARPHWGKLFTLPPARVQSLYPRLADFQQLLSRHDPHGKFRNAFLDKYIFGI